MLKTIYVLFSHQKSLKKKQYIFFEVRKKENISTTQEPAYRVSQHVQY